MNVIFKLLLSSDPREVFTRAWVNLFTLASFLHSGALSIHSFSTACCVFGLGRSLKWGISNSILDRNDSDSTGIGKSYLSY